MSECCVKGCECVFEGVKVHLKLSNTALQFILFQGFFRRHVFTHRGSETSDRKTISPLKYVERLTFA